MISKHSFLVRKRGNTSLYALLTMLFVAFIMMMSSCKKQQQSGRNETNEAAMKKISAATGTPAPRFPDVENGILVFDDESHFKKYIAFLDAAVDPKNYDSATLREKEFDQDEILETIENYLGFTSVRKISHDHFMQLNETGWDRLEDIPEEHFIRDAVMRSVLNSNLMMKIGNSYIRYINKDISVKVDASADAELFQAFSNLPQSATLKQVLSIDPGHRHSNVYQTLESGGLSIFGGGLQALAEGDLSIIDLNDDAPDCNNTKKIVFSGMQLWQQMPSGSFANGILEGSFVVDFGDGSPTQTYSSQYEQFSQNSVAIVPDFTHIYPAAGNYTVKVHATANAVYAGATSNTAELDYQVTVINTTCKNDKFKATQDEFHTVPDGSRAWSGKITVAFVQPWISDKTRVLSETSSWYWNGNKWKQSKAEIWHQLHTERRIVSGCTVIGQVDGDGWASSSKHITTHRTDDVYYWNKVTTKHGIKYNGTWLYFDKSLSVCD